MKRISELDALRGLAAIAIVVYHLWMPEYAILGTAVDLFFVMSGYLISTNNLRQYKDEHFLKTFYIRRSLRIWPIYYLAVVATILGCLLIGPPASSRGLPYYLTYTQNIQHYWFGESPPFFLGFKHTWTLAIEEQFYLLWPLLLMIGGRKALIPLSLIFTATAVIARPFGFASWILLTRSDGLALGGLLAAILADREPGLPAFRRPGRLLVMAALAAVGFRALGTFKPWGLPEPVGLSFRMLAMNLAYFALIGAVVRQGGKPLLAPLRRPTLIYLGKISYGIYLYHYIVFHLVDRLGWTDRVLIDGVKLSLSVGIAMLSWKYVEQPILGLKDRFGYVKSARRAAAPRQSVSTPTPTLMQPTV